MHRIKSIDFLKWIGLTCIILAHVGAPDWIMMIRSFDVPLMIILSGIMAKRSFKKDSNSKRHLINYYIHRAKRLVSPVWIFLIIYFIVCFLLGDPYMGASYYLYSFAFTRYGIGYVWIILIYLYGMLLVPAIEQNKPSAKTVVFLVLLYGIYEFAYCSGIGGNSKIIASTLYFIIPYGILYYIGYYYIDFPEKAKKTLIVISSLLFILLAIYYRYAYGTFKIVSIAKYPPRIYYLSFGLACSSMLLMICEKTNLAVCDNAIIKFVGSHTMWIYLWHILAVRLYKTLLLPETWYMMFFAVYFGSIFFTMIVNRLLDKMEMYCKLPMLKYFRG